MGRCVLSRTPRMNALAKEFEELALMASVLGRRPAMTPLDFLAEFSSKLGIQKQLVKVEVTAPPTDFFVRFVSSFDCERGLHLSGAFECCGAKMIFQRWHRGWEYC